ncbi:MAG: glycosyltransferase family 4 protein [Chloroflexi bacterium]|nr:glycosyltransferase family 4 protein [Chloroflexota bacterium]
MECASVVDRDRPLTVAIDSQINPANPGGVEAALVGLLRALAEAPGPERYALLSTLRYTSDLQALAGSAQRVIPWPYPQKAAAPYRTMTRRWQRLHRRAGRLGIGVDAAHRAWWHTRRALTRPPTAAQIDPALLEQAVDVVHFPYPVAFDTRLPYLYEPWDLQHRHHPEFFTDGERHWRDRIYRAGCEGARLVVTATQWTKRDIVAQYGIDPAKIAVVPRGPAVRARPTDEVVARIGRDLGLPERFAFYPAMTFPHKNHLRLFAALAILRDRHGISVPLVCTGRRYEPHWPAVEAGIERFGLGGHVRMLGPVPDETLAVLFHTAWVLVFPSLFEGLGLPVLEALHAGLPVLASNATCLPEVGRDAALFFDPTNVEAIVEALLAAERRPDILEHCRHGAPGVLARYSWERAAPTFVACYRVAAGRSLTSAQSALFAEAVDA